MLPAATGTVRRARPDQLAIRLGPPERPPPPWRLAPGRVAEHRPEQPGVSALQRRQRGDHLARAQFAAADHQHRAVGPGHELGGDRGGQDRRTVQQHVVEPHLEHPQQRGEVFGPHHLGGVRRQRATGQHLDAVPPVDQHLVQVQLAGQDRGQPGPPVQLQVLPKPGVGQIGLDQHHPLAVAGQPDGQIDRDRCLRPVQVRSGDHEGARRVVQVAEPQVGGDRPGGQDHGPRAAPSAARVLHHAQRGGAGQRQQVGGLIDPRIASALHQPGTQDRESAEQCAGQQPWQS